MIDAPYVPLWCRSNFSFLDGASHPEELVTEAGRLGLSTMALTDRDGLYGVVRAHVTAREVGVRVVVGADVTVGTHDRILLLAMTRAGYGNLCRLLSAGRLRSPKGASTVSWDEVAAQADGLIALWPGRIPEAPGTDVHDAFADEAMRAAFGDRLYALVTRHRQFADGAREHALRESARRVRVPVVAGMQVLYHVPARRELHDVVTCIRHGCTLSTAGRRTRPNAEHALRTAHAFGRLFPDDPEAIRRTVEVAERCTFSLDDLRYRYPSETLPDGSTSADRLAGLVRDGARERYPDAVPADVRRQLARELEIIHDLEYDGYFLTMWEIVRFCRREGILCQGRGSAANSAVCYALGITAVDPVRMGLLFERFLSRERNEPPDIDLDIEHDRREEVIQFVYERYGRRHAAMVANVVRYRARSAIREVGKALGVAETTLDRFSRMSSPYDTPTEESLREVGFEPGTTVHRDLLRLSLEIQDFPRHLSIHPGGFLLGHEPVDTLVPLENATMPGRTVVQWDKNDLEDLALFKVDLLGLGALNLVHRALDLLERHWGRRETLASIPPADEPTFDMICAADTVGTFQIESRAQMAMLPRLRPRTYYDLVIEVSIVRPGPITGGMVHPYLRRRAGQEPVTYAHPSLESILEKTLGVPIFQEQVMQLAVVAANYSAGEADQLRRDMAAWRSAGKIEQHRERLITRMVDNGIAEEFAERVFDQIRGFGEYGFPESHAASFALIAYATCWLKCHYPAAFTCSLLNAQPMGFYSPSTLVGDARRHGIVIEPVDVTRSDDDCTLEVNADSHGGFALRMGLRYVKGLAEADRDRLLAARANGPFADFDAFVHRTGLDRPVLARLAQAGALRTLDPDRRHALWRSLGAPRSSGPVEMDFDVTAPEREVRFDALDAMETVDWDYATVGHSARSHPLIPMREAIAARGLPTAEEVRRASDGRRMSYAGMVICRQRPGTASGVTFMTLEDETGFVNVVVWQRVFEEYRLLAKTLSFLGVTGKMQVEGAVVHLIADKLWKPAIVAPAEVASRDFH